MEDIQLTDKSDQQLSQGLLGRFDAPAFARRALQVEAACADLLQRCRRERAERLDMVRLYLGTLQALAVDWAWLGPFLASEEDLNLVRELHGALQPRLRAPVAPARTDRTLRRGLREFLEGLERFNRRWRRFLGEVDLTAVNRLRADYNRWYLLEKECAMGSWRLARTFFMPLEHWTLDTLLQELPLLPVPKAL